MKRNIIISFIFLFFFAFFPGSAFAVDFSIEDVKIEAYLQEDGNVHVREYHLYSFDGEFGGIIRELVPKEHASIENVKAFESGNELRIEKDDYEYRIHRAGEDEEIFVEITYTIINGVQVYEDVAQFYWPFFDKRNESTYNNMTIEIIPPSEVSGESVYAFGHDTAYETETILNDGTIRFELGKVASGKNGDIHAVYPAEYFANAPLFKQTTMLPSILEEEANYKQAQIEWAEKQASYASLGNKIILAGVLLLLFFSIKDYLKRRREVQAVVREVGDIRRVPSELLSLPATVSYINYHQLSPETMAASLLDLVRKGNVKQVGEDSFEAIHMNNLKKHEETFMNLLFYEIGENGKFTLSGLNRYVKNSTNKIAYYKAYSKWTKQVRQEITDSHFYEKHPIYKLLLIVMGLVQIPILIPLIRYDLPLLFVGGLLLSIFYILYGIFYYPKTWEARKLSYEWKKFTENYKSISESEWNNWTEDEQMRAFLYALATGNKELKKKNEDIIRPFKERAQFQTGDVAVAGFDPLLTMVLLSSTTSSSFKRASESAGFSPSSSDGGSSFTGMGGGGGVGGGGGGSGAF